MLVWVLLCVFFDFVLVDVMWMCVLFVMCGECMLFECVWCYLFFLFVVDLVFVGWWCMYVDLVLCFGV